MGVELFYEDGQTSMTKLTAAFQNFANMLRKPQKCLMFRLV